LARFKIALGLTFPRRSLPAFQVGGEQLKAAVMMQNYDVNMGLQLFSLFAWLLGSFVFCLAIRHFIRPTQWKV